MATFDGQSFSQLTNLNITDEFRINGNVIAGTELVYATQSSATSQEPTVLDDPIQIEYGASPIYTTGAIEIDSLGVTTFNESGTYLFIAEFEVGRSSTSGTSIIFGRILQNDVQLGPTFSATLPTIDTRIPLGIAFIVTATTDTELYSQLYRDSSGVNDGGLFATTPTLSGWSDSPTAYLSVYKV